MDMQHLCKPLLLHGGFFFKMKVFVIPDRFVGVCNNMSTLHLYNVRVIH